MLEEALKYAAIGWAIHPVNKSKRPLTVHGSLDATCDIAIIQEWYTQKKGAGIALATGDRSKIAVIDLDYGKEEYIPFIEEFIKMFGVRRAAIQSSTGSGGTHLFFKIPEGKTVSNAVAFKGFKGVDIRGTGGYVVLPPSYNDVGQYLWKEGCSPFENVLEDAPEFLHTTTRTFKLNYEQSSRLEKGTRNTSMASIAGRLRSSGLDRQELLEEMRQQNKELCVPPLTDEEVEKIVDSICRYPAQNNRIQVSDVANEPIPESSNTEEAPTLRDLLRFPRTDAGRAELIRFLHRGQIKYNFRDGKYYLWDGIRWRKDTTDQVNNIVVNAARRLQQASQAIQDDSDRKDALSKAKQMENTDKIRSCLSVFRSLGDVATEGDEWDANNYLLGVKNGVVDLRTGELLPANRENLMVMDTKVNYNPQATCPRWEQFISEVFNDDKQLIDFVQKASGYALTGLTSEQCIFLLVGDGSNGKSVFLSTIMSVLGDYGTVANFSTFEKQLLQNTTQTNDIASLAGKRLVTSSETSATATFNEARIKALTGGEKMSARFLYQEAFSFAPVLKLWLAVNHAPRVQDDSYGFWRRIRRINFTRQFLNNQADQQLPNKLQDELEGILMWMIRGAVRWFKEGLNIPDAVQKAVDEYRNVSDTVVSFVQSCIESADDAVVVSAEDLFARYGTWCRTGNIPLHERMSREAFHTAAAKHLKTKLNDRGRKVYYGIKVIQPEDTVNGFSIAVSRI